MLTQLSKTIIQFLCGTSVALLVIPSAWGAIMGDVVGEITTVIGRGSIVNANGEQSAARGVLVRAGDRIETHSGGHVHVRFVDGGLASVRPMSRLLIEDYRQGDSRNLAAIKFKLEDGVMRSVTGRWGEANRDRFRLNTPVAAIGIKGTDFIVRTGGGSTLATVNSGAIVMAPLEGACALSLGPCQSERSTLLSADMQGQMLEYFKQSGGVAPRLIATVEMLDQRAVAAPQLDQRAPNKVEVAMQTDAADKTRINENIAVTQLQDTVGSTDATSSGKPMVWLHNQANWNVPDHTISQRYDAALADGRVPVVGNFFITLYRDETVKKEFAPASVTAAFQLSNASATYALPLAYGRPVEVVQISNANLNVDFVASTLSTSLRLNSSALGQQDFSASATVNPQGVFTSHTSNQNFAGAFSTDGRQAGYTFDKMVGEGKVSGLTLWGR